MFSLAANVAAFCPINPIAPKLLTDGFELKISRRSILASIAAATFTVASLPNVAVAVDAPSIAGVYTDPNHPKGYRVVRETKGGVAITLQDDPHSEIIDITAKAKANKKNGETTLTIDFSKKGGPKNISGVFKDGKISFPDGNSWPKATGIQGVYSDPNHPKGWRVVRVGADGRGTVQLQDGETGPVLNLSAKMKSKNSILFIDFSPKGGPTNVSATFRGNKLIFPDGNEWEKL